MEHELLKYHEPITEEEQKYLDGKNSVEKDLYTSEKQFVIDSKKLLQKGRLIEIRPHTRFVHFPRHRHNYVEMVYMCKGQTQHIINGCEKLVLNEGDLLLMNQNAYHEILPASGNDIAVNFIILPEFFHYAIDMAACPPSMRLTVLTLIPAFSAKVSCVKWLSFLFCLIRSPNWINSCDPARFPNTVPPSTINFTF